VSAPRGGRHSVPAIVAGATGCLAVAVALFTPYLAFRGPGAHHTVPAPPAHTRPPATARHPDPLTGAAASYVSRRTGTVLATVYDVQTGQTWRLGQGPPQPAASVVKLDILETLLAHRSSGLSAANRSLAQLMIEDSDNDAATSLWYAAQGASGLRAYNEAAGLTDTTASPCVECAGFAWPGWGLSTTVPDDQITLLKELIEPGTLLTPAERDYTLSLLENITPSQRWGVSGGVPAQVTVALKNGWLPLDAGDTDWQINSVGWISGDGSDYLMAVLTTGNPTEQYGIDTIDQLGAIVWKAMS
jgi:Beta-lactamase enzyme family